MELTGEKIIHAPRHTVYDALHDPAVLRRVVPGLERLAELDGERVGLEIALSLGPLARAGYTATVSVYNTDPPAGYSLRGEAHTSPHGADPASSARGTAHVALAAVDERTTNLAYYVAVELDGGLATLDPHVAEVMARTLAAEFFSRLQLVIEDERPGAAFPAVDGGTIRTDRTSEVARIPEAAASEPAAPGHNDSHEPAGAANDDALPDPHIADWQAVVPRAPQPVGAAATPDVDFEAMSLPDGVRAPAAEPGLDVPPSPRVAATAAVGGAGRAARRTASFIEPALASAPVVGAGPARPFDGPLGAIVAEAGERPRNSAAAARVGGWSVDTAAADTWVDAHADTAANARSAADRTPADVGAAGSGPAPEPTAAPAAPVAARPTERRDVHGADRRDASQPDRYGLHEPQSSDVPGAAKVEPPPRWVPNPTRDGLNPDEAALAFEAPPSHRRRRVVLGDDTGGAQRWFLVAVGLLLIVALLNDTF